MDWGNSRFNFIRRFWESRTGDDAASASKVKSPKRARSKTNSNDKMRDHNGGGVLKSFKSALFKQQSKCQQPSSINQAASTAVAADETITTTTAAGRLDHESKQLHSDVTQSGDSTRKLRHRTYTTPANFVVHSMRKDAKMAEDGCITDGVSHGSVCCKKRFNEIRSQSNQQTADVGEGRGGKFNKRGATSIHTGKFVKLQSFWTMQEQRVDHRGNDHQKRCCICQQRLKLNNSYEHEGNIFCHDDYTNQFVQSCKKCTHAITGPIIIAGVHRFHPECFQCKCCKLCISDGDLYGLILAPDDSFLTHFCYVCFQNLLTSVTYEDGDDNMSMIECILVLVVDFYPSRDVDIPKYGPDSHQSGSIAYGVIVGKEEITNTTLSTAPGGGKKQVLIGFTDEKMETGLKKGDIFLQVNGLTVDNNVLDLVDRLTDDSNEPLKVTVQRNVRLPEEIISGSASVNCGHLPSTTTTSSSNSNGDVTVEASIPGASCDDVTIHGSVADDVKSSSSSSSSFSSDTTTENEFSLANCDNDVIISSNDEAEGTDVNDPKLESSADMNGNAELTIEGAAAAAAVSTAVESSVDDVIIMKDVFRKPEDVDRKKKRRNRRRLELPRYSTEELEDLGDEDTASTTQQQDESCKLKNSRMDEISEITKNNPPPHNISPVRRCQSLKNDVIMRNLFDRSRQNVNSESPLSEDRSLMGSLSNFASALPNQSTDNSDLIRSESMRLFANTFRSQRVFRPCDLILGEALGKGFFGQAIKVTHRDTGEVMVLKELNSLDPETEKSFLKEVKVMRNLSHPNVLRFIGVLYKEKKLNIISEFIECGTLSNVLANMEKKLSWGSRIRMARDITSGMSYLHSMSIVHRDLNTTNCFVKETGTVVVADFGLARVIHRSNAMGTRRKRYTIVGNPYWMAPEMCFNKPYTEMVDVFAFGIVCCEIIGRTQADPDFLPRSNDFGLAVYAFYQKFCLHDICPPFFFAIAVRASSMNPDDRPSFQTLDGWFQILAMKGDIPSFPEPPNLTICIKEVYREYNIYLPINDLYTLPVSDC